MENFLKKLDSLASIETENKTAKLLERVSFIFLVLMVVSAPHSIAATQISWLTGMFLWVIRLFIKPRPKLIRTPLDFALWAFLGWSFVSSVFSYDPATSLDRLRNVLLFLIFYYVVNVVRSVRAVKFLASALIFSCMFNVVWTPIERIFGRGVEVYGVSAESPLAKGKVIEGVAIADGNTIIEVDKKKIRTPESLIEEIEKKEVSQIKFYQPDFNSVVEVKRSDLLSGENAIEKLGIKGWKNSRVWRSSGFYSHYTTYSEVLLLIGSLTLGFFIALDKKRSPLGLILLFCLAGISLALLLTVTRASQLGFLISAFAIVAANGNRKMLLSLAAIILPLALIGVVFLQQSRKVGFFDTQDDSIKWRQTVWREGFNLWTANPRHFFLGVGMDSIKKYAKEWRLFDNGRLPMGHFHSTPLQLLVERGLPALLIWLWILWIYARTLLRALMVKGSKFKGQSRQTADYEMRNEELKIEDKSENRQLKDWQTKGVLLGCFGGLIGFFTSGLVHYNLGDAEVAMVFFMLMGLSVSLVIKNAKFPVIKFNFQL